MTGPAISPAVPNAVEARAGGVWTLSGERLIIAEPGGPATVLVPSESVLLLAVDLPLASRAKRLAALPFAIEDRIADPLDAVHIALGAEIAPQRYLVAVVRHTLMLRWIELADAAPQVQAERRRRRQDGHRRAREDEQREHRPHHEGPARGGRRH